MVVAPCVQVSRELDFRPWMIGLHIWKFVLSTGNLAAVATRAGHLHEDMRYRTVRPGGGSDWLLILTVAGCGLHTGVRGSRRIEPGLAILYQPREPQDYATAADLVDFLEKNQLVENNHSYIKVLYSLITKGEEVYKTLTKPISE